VKDPLRLVVTLFAVLTGYLTLAIFFRWPFVEELWPWPGYDAKLSPLSFVFLSSIAAAICAPLAWLAWTNSMRAAIPGAIDLIVSLGAITIFLATEFARDTMNIALLVWAVLLGASVVGNVLVLRAVRRRPFRDPTPMPRPVYIAFIVFAVALVLVGQALVRRVPDIIPWTLSGEASVVYGWIFLGAACYFVVALREPRWENAAGQLLGFLAYDLVLIGPFIRHFSTVPDHLRLNLILYTAVVVSSGLLAIVYCFLHPRTRLFFRPAATQ